jgi:hypothetical protein
VHFGDTRYELTPANVKWLPNDHPEEHTTTKTRTVTRTITATHYTALTQYTFALRNGWHYGTQVSRERERRWRGLVLFVLGRSDEEITHDRFELMICDVHFGDTRNDITPARTKWLPNDHTEEQYTTNKYSRIIWLQTHGKRRII